MCIEVQFVSTHEPIHRCGPRVLIIWYETNDNTLVPRMKEHGDTTDDGGAANTTGRMLSSSAALLGSTSAKVCEESSSGSKFSITGDRDLLRKNLLGDVVVACGVTFMVAPFMTVVDKAIVQRAAGTHGVLLSAVESVTSMARNPVSYVRSPMFLMMWGVYAATYTAANVVRTITTEHMDEVSPDEAKAGLFVATTAVNSGSTMLKDRAYATMFGSSGSAARVPLITYGLWGLRDCMVVGSSFVLPDLVADSFTPYAKDRAQAAKISQFFCPVATQVIAGPVQLLGLDFYNRPLKNLSYASATMERISFLGKNFFSILGARVSRIAPAYGIGGIGNTYFRNEWRDMVIRQEVFTNRSYNNGSRDVIGATIRSND